MGFLRWLASLLRHDTPSPAPAPSPAPEPQPQPDPAPTPAPAPAPPGVIDALNAERARDQLPALREDARLTESATAWAGEMARANELTHGDFSARISAVYPNTAAAEDIAEGVSTVDAVVSLWMNSRPHRANILGPFSLAGAGSATADDGTVYWCVDFDEPQGETASP